MGFAGARRNLSIIVPNKWMARMNVCAMARDGAVVTYLDIVCIKGADDMSDHDVWVSYSHWGMFTLERKSSRRSN
jgi:hypothetical protein